MTAPCTGTNAYADWCNAIYAWAGTDIRTNIGLTVWPFQYLSDGVTPDDNYGQPAIWIRTAFYATLAGTAVPNLYAFPAAIPANGVESNPQGTLVYVLASVMSNGGAAAAADAADWATGNGSLDPPPSDACGGIIGELGLCNLGQELETALKWAAIGVGGLILIKTLL